LTRVQSIEIITGDSHSKFIVHSLGTSIISTKIDVHENEKVS